METIKLTLSKWVVKELHYYEAHHQINLNDFISKSVTDYLNNNYKINSDDIITSNTMQSEISVEMPNEVVNQLKEVLKHIPISYSDVVNTALAFTVPNLISALEVEDEFTKRGTLWEPKWKK